MGHEDRVMIMGNGKWNDIHQGWTGPAVYRFAGKPQWYWEESAERLRNHSNLKPGTNFVPYSSNDNDKLEEMHDTRCPGSRRWRRGLTVRVPAGTWRTSRSVG
jgi:hypothetical protein